MPDGFNNQPVGGGGNLVRQSIQSPNFVSGSAGWIVRKDGSAEFNNVVIRGGEVISGITLIYNGPPAHGNLILSISAGGGTDAFGNVYQPGTVSYSTPADTYTQLIGGQLQIFNATAGGLASVFISDGGVLAVTGTAGVISFQVAVPISQPIYASTPSNFTVAETWHNMALLNSWTLGANGYAQYKLEPNNRVSIRGANIVPGTTTPGTSIWTPPSGYAPTLYQRIAMFVEVSTGAAGVDTPRLDATATGLTVNNVPGSTTLVGFNASYALD